MALLLSATTEIEEFDRVLAHGGLRAVYQPIVRLSDRRTVAVESLARGPVGSPLESPLALFRLARRLGRTQDLDRACRAAALAGARPAAAAGLTLFVNVEPGALDGGDAEAEADRIAEGAHGTPVVVELAERALGRDPARLLALVRRLRRRGLAVALDDVGAAPESLALLPLIRPEVVKLDLWVVQRRSGARVAEVVAAVGAYAEESGALVVAEGIEHQAHLRAAQAMGASYGQGWWLGRPAPLATLDLGPGASLDIQGGAVLGEDPDASPYALCSQGRAPVLVDKALLVAVSRRLERQALAQGRHSVVLASFEEARFLTPDTRRRYRRLADRTAFVAVLGEGIGGMPESGVRGAHLAAGDPVRREWDLVVLGPHLSAALVARDLGDVGADGERRFASVVTYDRPLVCAAGRALISRVVAPSRRGARH